MITIDPPSSPPTSTPALSRPTLTRFLNRARTAIQLSGNVDVLLTSDAELQRLNRTFRGKNKPTDVLSFPASPVPGLPLAHQHAGDLAISLDTARRQADSFNHSLQTELQILLLHGLLHLAGLDHETDTGEMAARESRLRTQLRLPNSLIARTMTKPAQPRPATSPRAIRSSTRAVKSAPPVPKPPSSNLSSRPKRSAAERAPRPHKPHEVNSRGPQ